MRSPTDDFNSHLKERAFMRLQSPGSLFLLFAAVCLFSFGSLQNASAQPANSGQKQAVSEVNSGSDDGIGLVNVQQNDLLQRRIADNWVSYNGDYTGRRSSSLTQIKPENANHLAAQWVFYTREVSPLEVTPVVVAGVMFITSGNDVYALDAATGKLLWRHSRALTQGLVDDAAVHHNRGVAVLGTRVYMETDNAHLLCLDARSGSLIWDVAYATGNKNYGATSAPLIVKDKVIVGTSGGDDGVRGFLAAFDVQTGKESWRFWTIPGPGEKGNESWPGDSYLHGGGTTWMPGTYDPDLNTLYWGTGNPSPDYDGSARPGDDLYTSCLLALDPDTGTLKWFFQFSPHDLYDYDAVQTPVLVDAMFEGRPRKLAITANRNGFLYILDRTNGKFLFAKQFAMAQNWAKGIDENGRPVSAGLIPSEDGVAICPANGGATNWYSPSYNPQMHIFYFRSYEACAIIKSRTEPFEEGSTYYSTGARILPGS
jgi:alcohol dehydrogenase (cytochrome c)